ncbi:hypothetical protein FQZ97_1016510 [compost metagenome]
MVTYLVDLQASCPAYQRLLQVRYGHFPEGFLTDGYNGARNVSFTHGSVAHHDHFVKRSLIGTHANGDSRLRPADGVFRGKVSYHGENEDIVGADTQGKFSVFIRKSAFRLVFNRDGYSRKPLSVIVGNFSGNSLFLGKGCLDQQEREKQGQETFSDFTALNDWIEF